MKQKHQHHSRKPAAVTAVQASAPRPPMSAKEFALAFGISDRHVINLVESGTPHGLNISAGSRQCLRIPSEEVERFTSSRSSLNA
jgi:hypothetical protein